MSASPACPMCGGSVERVDQGRGCLDAEQFDAVRAGDWYCSNCPETAGTAGKSRLGCAYFWDRDIIHPARPSGVETVREEMLADEPLMLILADPRHSIDPTVAETGRRISLVDIDALLARAARFYGVFAEVSEDTAKPRPLDWSELSAKRVRAWVAVAREAGRL